MKTFNYLWKSLITLLIVGVAIWNGLKFTNNLPDQSDSMISTTGTIVQNDSFQETTSSTINDLFQETTDGSTIIL